MKRNHAIDSARLLCAFLVICIHTPFPGIIGGVTSIARTAVPFFFIVSGYFYSYKEEQSLKPVRKVLCLIFESTLIYFVWVMFVLLSGKHDIWAYFREMITIKTMYSFLAFNFSPLRDHLWYLNALLYVYLLETIAHRYGQERKIRLIAIPLLLIGIGLGKYSFIFHFDSIEPFYFRNAWFIGIPFFELGRFIKEKQEKICKYASFYFGIVFLFSMVFLLMEAGALKIRRLGAYGDIFLFTPLLAVTSFMLLLRVDMTKSKVMALVSKMGNRYSGYIYILQFITIDIIDKIQKISSKEIMGTWLTPILVFGATLILAVMYVSTKKFLFKNVYRDLNFIQRKRR